MNDSGWKNPPAGAMVPGPDGCAYLVPHGPQAAFRLTGGQARGPAGPPVSETFGARARGTACFGNLYCAGTVPGGIPAGKRIRESLAHLPQMPVHSC
jgi:hypothetical protein